MGESRRPELPLSTGSERPAAITSAPFAALRKIRIVFPEQSWRGLPSTKNLTALNFDQLVGFGYRVDELGVPVSVSGWTGDVQAGH
jgi:hypothetical protein